MVDFKCLMESCIIKVVATPENVLCLRYIMCEVDEIFRALNSICPDTAPVNLSTRRSIKGLYPEL